MNPYTFHYKTHPILTPKTHPCKSAHAVRYAWAAFPQCVLYNGAGGPDDHRGIAASPFWLNIPRQGTPPRAPAAVSA